MKKIDWFWIIIALVAVIAVDQVSKILALGIRGTHSFGILHFRLLYNNGLFMGSFSELPPILRIVSLSTFAAFLLFLFLIFQYMLPSRSLLLRNGLSILLGGILSNVFDRIYYGYVVDFLILGWLNSLSSGVFNIADALQWVGYGMMAVGVFKDREKLWPKHDTRTGAWINWSFQLRYSMVFVAIGLGFAIIAGVYSYTFLRFIVMDISSGHIPRNPSDILRPWLLIYGLVSLGFAIILFLVGKSLSHRMAGPIYAFERYIKDVIGGESKKLQLRSSDEFKNLEHLAEMIVEELIARNRADVIPNLPEGLQIKNKPAETE